MVYPEVRIHTKRIEIPAGYMNNMTALIFDELSANIKASYRAVERMEETNDYRSTREPLLRNDIGGSRIEWTILPFSMTETSEAWWRIWHNYRGKHVHDATSNVVKESFGLEISDVKTNTSATFYVQQALHRYMEEHRVVYVWNMYTEPFLFKHNRISDVYYREQSHVVIKPINQGSMANSGDMCCRPKISNPNFWIPS